VRVALGGTGQVGPGVSTFYFADAHTGFVADLTAFYEDLKDRFPQGMTVSVPNSGDLIDEATGTLTGTWTDGTAGAVTGTAVDVFAQGVGARIVWNTSGVTNGRRVKGSTYLVPLVAGCYDTGGTLLTTPLGDFTTAAFNLWTAGGGNMVILTRPVEGAGGKSSVVTSSSVPDKVSWLRSRRT